MFFSEIHNTGSPLRQLTVYKRLITYSYLIYSLLSYLGLPLAFSQKKDDCN